MAFCNAISLCNTILSLSDFQSLMQRFAGRFLVFVERMGIDIQCCGRLAVAQQARHRGYVCAVGNQQAGVGVTRGVDIQCGRQAVLLQNQLEPPGEAGGRHGEPVPMTAEDVVRILQFPPIIRFRLPGALPLELP